MFPLFKRRQPAPALVAVDPLQWQFAVEPGQTILQAALAQGLPWPSRCRVGSCTTCRCRLLEGEVRELTDTTYVLSRRQLDDSYILACQSQPLGRVRVQLDRVRSTLTDDAAESLSDVS
jgi:ferredoxin